MDISVLLVLVFMMALAFQGGNPPVVKLLFTSHRSVPSTPHKSVSRPPLPRSNPVPPLLLSLLRHRKEGEAPATCPSLHKKKRLPTETSRT